MGFACSRYKCFKEHFNVFKYIRIAPPHHQQAKISLWLRRRRRRRRKTGKIAQESENEWVSEWNGWMNEGQQKSKKKHTKDEGKTTVCHECEWGKARRRRRRREPCDRKAVISLHKPFSVVDGGLAFVAGTHTWLAERGNDNRIVIRGNGLYYLETGEEYTRVIM